VEGRSYGGKIRRHVMLEALLANEVQQLLHLRDFDYARAPEGIERVVGKFAFAYVAPHFASGVIRRETRKAHLLGLDEADAGSKVFSFPTVPAMISWKFIFTERKKCLGRFEQWKQTALLGSEP